MTALAKHFSAGVSTLRTAEDCVVSGLRTSYLELLVGSGWVQANCDSVHDMVRTAKKQGHTRTD